MLIDSDEVFDLTSSALVQIYQNITTFVMLADLVIGWYTLRGKII